MAKKARYEDLANEVIKQVGGKDNITYLTHCITRLRFGVKDKSLIDLKEIEKIEGVVGAQWSGEQLQIIIGQAVGDAYKLICEKTGIQAEKGIDENLDQPKQKFGINMIIDSISGSLTPLIPVLIGCGMVKVLLLVIEMAGVLDPASSTYQVLTWVGDAGFYFLPVFVGKAAAKKFGANESLGMLMGAMLIYPAFVSGVAEGTAFDFLGIPIYGAGYTSSIFPVILCVAVMAPIQRFFAKISPDTVRSITEPLLTILVMIPLAFCLIGPAGAFVGQYLADFILWLYNTAGFLAVSLLAAIMPFVVMTGMHSAFTPYLITMLGTVGYEPIFLPAMVISNINQGAASAAVAVRTKNKTLRSTGISSAITAVVGGVTEPAMYGINLRYKKPMMGAMIGSLAGGLSAGLLHVYLYAFAGSAGLFAIPAFIGPVGTNVIYLCISMAIGFVVTFVATLFLYKDEEVA